MRHPLEETYQNTASFDVKIQLNYQVKLAQGSLLLRNYLTHLQKEVRTLGGVISIPEDTCIMLGPSSG